MAITISLFDLYKIGPGPSSSHTMGPMTAGLDFQKRLQKLDDEDLARADHLGVTLYGSLSATGKGHGTDRAVVAGLLGWHPEEVDPDEFDLLLTPEDKPRVFKIKNKELPCDQKTVAFGPIQHGFAHANTLEISLDAKGESILHKRYYSVGGGFIQWDGWRPLERKDPKYQFETMEGLKTILRKKGMDIPDVVMANEIAMTGLSGSEIEEKLDHILEVMESSLERGLNTRGPLPGEIGLGRKAAGLAQRAQEETHKPGRILLMFNAYALAVAEENAAGHVVVTAPTMGSCGVMPAVVRLAREYFRADRKTLRRGLMTAAVIGFLAKHNASISGAEVGCQGEIGVASAMAAAFLAQVRGASMDILANAAEIALEHHLGMTCDPVKGYVQIPCVERNAMGAVKAYNAYLLASAGDPGKQKVSFDQVIQVMLDTGRDMSCKYKETSLGGLAVSMAQC